MASRSDETSPRTHDNRLVDRAVRRAQSTLSTPPTTPAMPDSETGTGTNGDGEVYTVHVALYNLDRYNDPAAVYFNSGDS